MLNSDLINCTQNNVELRQNLYTAFWNSWPFVRNKTQSIANRNLVRLSLNEFDRIISLDRKYRYILEQILAHIRYTSNTNFAAASSFSLKDNWQEIEQYLITNKDVSVARIKDDIDSENLFKTVLYDGATELIRRIENNKTNLKSEFSTNMKRLQYLHSKIADNIGFVMCQLLYVQYCTQILSGVESYADSSRINDGLQTCDEYKRQLFEALKTKDYTMVRYFGHELSSVSEIVGEWTAASITSQHAARRRYVKDELKNNSLHDELNSVKLLKQCIANYAMGLYFHTAQELTLQRESRYADRLEYDRQLNPDNFVEIDKLLGNPQNYDNKTVTVRGIVNTLNERKWFVGGNEAVSSEFELADASASIRALRYGRMFHDNGLDEQVAIELSGTFQTDENGVYLNISGFDCNRQRTKSWLQRCDWLAARVWDNGTNKCQCDWTLSTLTPEETPQLSLGNYTCDEEDYKEGLEEIREKYPIARAATGALKEISKKMESKYFAKRVQVTSIVTQCINLVLSSVYDEIQE